MFNNIEVSDSDKIKICPERLFQVKICTKILDDSLHLNNNF